MNSSRHIMRWLAMIVITFVVVDFARAENIPEMVRRHDSELRQLQEKISNFETQFNSLLKEMGEGPALSPRTLSECVSIQDNEGNRVIKINETWITLSGKLKLRPTYMFFQRTTRKYYVNFKSNISELSLDGVIEKSFIKFTVDSCSYSLQILDIDTEVDTVTVALLDF